MILSALCLYLYVVAGIVCAVFDADDTWSRRIAVVFLWAALLPGEAVWRFLARRLLWVPEFRRLFRRRRRTVYVVSTLMTSNVPIQHGHSFDCEPVPLVITDVNYRDLV